MCSCSLSGESSILFVLLKLWNSNQILFLDDATKNLNWCIQILSWSKLSFWEISKAKIKAFNILISFFLFFLLLSYINFFFMLLFSCYSLSYSHINMHLVNHLTLGPALSFVCLPLEQPWHTAPYNFFFYRILGYIRLLSITAVFLRWQSDFWYAGVVRSIALTSRNLWIHVHNTLLS